MTRGRLKWKRLGMGLYESLTPVGIYCVEKNHVNDSWETSLLTNDNLVQFIGIWSTMKFAFDKCAEDYDLKDPPNKRWKVFMMERRAMHATQQDFEKAPRYSFILEARDRVVANKLADKYAPEGFVAHRVLECVTADLPKA